MKRLILGILCMFFAVCISASAEEASMNFVINISEYLQIKTLTSPVLTANITDKTGNLLMPLSSKFRVISNAQDSRTLYLKGSVNTTGGEASALFERGARVYLAFANLSKQPTMDSLLNCKVGAGASESAGIVAYPVTSITGAKSKYIRGKEKYEVYVNNGISDITVNIGSRVLKSSFSTNDPRGFYQATLSLTEADI